MSEVDWGALGGEVGLLPPPPRPTPKPQIGEVGGVEEEIQRRAQELNDILPPGAKFTLNLPTGRPGATPGSNAPQPTPQPVAPAGAPQAPAAPASTPAGLNWDALAGEVGLPPIPRNSTAGAVGDGVGSTIAAGMQMQGLQGNPLDAMTQGLEGIQAPEWATLAGTQAPGGTPEQEASKAALIASGQDVMSPVAEQPAFPMRVMGALHDYFSAKMRGGIAGNEAALEEAKRRLNDEAMQVMRAGGTAWNGLVSTAQQIPEVGAALKDAAMGLMGGVAAGAAGAAGIPGATPDVVQSELARSRTGAEKAGQIGMGLAAAPVDPWMAAAQAPLEEGKSRFRKMLEEDPVTTLALMAGSSGMVKGGLRKVGPVAEKLGATFETPPRPPTPEVEPHGKVPASPSSLTKAPGPRGESAPPSAPAPTAVEGLPTYDIGPGTVPIEKRIEALKAQHEADTKAEYKKGLLPGETEAQRNNRLGSIGWRQYKAMEPLIEERAWTEVQRSQEAVKARERGEAPPPRIEAPAPGEFTMPPERRTEVQAGPRDNLEELVAKAEGATSPAEKRVAYGAAHKALYDTAHEIMQKRGMGPEQIDAVFLNSSHLNGLNERLGNVEWDLGAEGRAAQKSRPPIPREPTPASSPAFTYATKQDTKKGPIHYWKADRDMPDGGGKAGSMVSEDVIRRNGFEPPPVPGRKVYQGRGATPENVYGPEAVKQGRAVPLFGPAEYFAHTEKDARHYGEVTEHNAPELKNPLVLDSDAKWFGLLGDANTPHLNNMGEAFYKNPKGIAPDTLKLQKYLKGQGYDGVIIKLDPYSDVTKRLSGMVGHDQTIAFDVKRLAETKREATSHRQETKDFAIGESLRYGKQRVVVKEVLRNPDTGELMGYRVKGKYDRAPFVVSKLEAKPWGVIVSKKPPGLRKIGELTHEDLGNTEVVARWLRENGGLKLEGETKNLAETIADPKSGLSHLKGVVRKEGRSVDDLAEELGQGGGPFRDREHAKEWLEEWIVNQGAEGAHPMEDRFVEHTQEQGRRFGVNIPERRARLAFVGRDRNPIVVNPREGQKAGVKVGDVVLTGDDVFRVKRDPQNPGKLMLKDGFTVRPGEGQTVEGVKVGKMPVRTREELKAAGRSVPEEIRAVARGEAPAPEPPPEEHADLRSKIEVYKDLEGALPEKPAQNASREQIRAHEHLRDEKRAIEIAFDDMEKERGKFYADVQRDQLGWTPRDEDVLAGARRQTDEAAAKTKRLAEKDRLRTKGVKERQRSLVDEEANRAIEEETEGREYEKGFKKGQKGLLGYPEPVAGEVRRAAARPVPLEKNLTPQRPEAVVRAQDIKRRLERILLAPIRYGVGRKKALGFFRIAERVIRTKKYLDLPVDFHEAGHALQQMLFPEIDMLRGKEGFNIKGPYSKAMRKELTALGKALYGKRKPVKGYKSEGLAEFTRLYIEDRAKAQAEAPVFYKEFRDRLLQDGDTVEIGRVLDESQDAYDRFRKQPAVAKALSRLSIGESKPRRWSLDRISSALFDNQKFIETFVRAANGGKLPEFAEGNPIAHAHLLRGWTGLPEAALGKGGGVADIRTTVAFPKKGEGLSDILRRPGVADKPLPFVNEAVRTYEKLSPTERILRRFTNKFTDADNMRGLDTFRAYWYARRTLSIAEGDVARAYARRANVSDKVALSYVRQHDMAARKGATFRDTGLSFEDARQVLKDLETPELSKAVDDVTKFSNRVLHWYVEEGMWTEDQYRKVIEHPANQVYMPLDRWFSEYGDRGAGGFVGRSISGAKPDVGRLKGSDVPIIDPLETTVANTYMVAQTVLRNRAMRTLAEFASERPGTGWISERMVKPIRATKFQLAELKAQIDTLIERAGGDPETLEPSDYEAWGRVFRPATRAPGGKNIATYFSKGKEKWVEMDPELYRAVSGLDQESMNKFIKIFGAAARWTRAGATLTPEFFLRNLFRDPITASILSETGTVNPFTGAVPVVTQIRGMREMLKNGDASFRYRASGAMHASMVSLDRDYLRGQARRLLTDDSAMRKISGVVHHPIDALRALGELGETSTRLGTFIADQARTLRDHNAILEAAIKSREGTTDFNRYGSVMEPFARLVPFFNPGVQSVRRFNVVTGRAIADIAKSVRAMARGELRAPEYAARYASRVLTYVVAPSVVLHFLRKETGRQDDYLELPAWRRHLFWNVPLPKDAAKRWGFNWLSVPKPFEIGVLYGTGTEAMLEWMDEHDSKSLSEYQDSLVGAFTPNIIPAFMSASIENLANRKVAFDRPIMPESQKALEPRLQYGLYTSETAKVLAGGVRKLPSLVGKPVAFAIKLTAHQEGVNAYDVDNLIRSLSAGMGQYYITPAMDFVIRRIIGGTKEGERLGVGTAATTKARASDVPLLRAFIPRGNEPGAGLIERTYQDIAESERAWNSYVKLEGWQKDEYLEDSEKRRLIVGRHVLQQVRDGLAAVNSQVLKARKAGDEELVDHLRELSADMARNAKPRIEEALKDETASKAIAIERELSRMRSEAHGRRAEVATVLEAFVEADAPDEKVRGYLEELEGEDRRWAVGYIRKLKIADKLNAEREAKKGASHREKFKLKQMGILP